MSRWLKGCMWCTAGPFAERDVDVKMWKMASEQRTERAFLCLKWWAKGKTLGCDRSACYSGRVFLGLAEVRFVRNG